MTTKIAKLLVYVNLFVGVGLFAWAVSLYSNRAEWFDRKDADPPVEGLFTKLDREVRELNASVPQALEAYSLPAAQTDELERVRDERANKLGDRLARVRKGDNPDIVFREHVKLNDPLFPALIDVNREGAVVKGVRDLPLQGLGYLTGQMAQAVRDEVTTQKQIAEARKKLTDLSALVLVRQKELDDQKLIRVNLGEQKTYLADNQINWEEQLRILERRQSQLKLRLEQLGITTAVSRADK